MMPGPAVEGARVAVVIFAVVGRHFAVIPLEMSVAIRGQDKAHVAAATPVFVRNERGITDPHIQLGPQRDGEIAAAAEEQVRGLSQCDMVRPRTVLEGGDLHGTRSTNPGTMLAAPMSVP